MEIARPPRTRSGGFVGDAGGTASKSSNIGPDDKAVLAADGTGSAAVRYREIVPDSKSDSNDETLHSEYEASTVSDPDGSSSAQQSLLATYIEHNRSRAIRDEIKARQAASALVFTSIDMEDGSIEARNSDDARRGLQTYAAKLYRDVT
ncbi:MAG: hypothetical protein AAGE61_14340 [Pseudomonadota bacterium]